MAPSTARAENGQITMYHGGLKVAFIVEPAQIESAAEEDHMGRCDVCGNEYDKPLEIRQKGRTGTFDSFECAIQALAPICGHCGCRIIGHGVEAEGTIFCCANCARAEGMTQFRA